MNSQLAIYLNLHRNIHIADILTWIIPCIFLLFHYMYFIVSGYVSKHQLQASCQMVIKTNKPIVFDYPNRSYVLIGNSTIAQDLFNNVWTSEEWVSFISKYNIANFLCLVMYCICFIIILIVNSRYVLNWHPKYFSLVFIIFLDSLFNIYNFIHPWLLFNLQKQQFYFIYSFFLFFTPFVLFIFYWVFTLFFYIFSYNLYDIHATKCCASYELLLLMQKNQNTHVERYNNILTTYGFYEQNVFSIRTMNDFFDLLIEHNRLGITTTKVHILRFIDNIEIKYKSYFFKAHYLLKKYMILTQIADTSDQIVYDEQLDERKKLYENLLQYFEDINVRCVNKRESRF